jgi:methylenetetrahydrofolate reductase (NADPH)
MSFVEKLGKEFVVTGEVEPAAAVSDSFLQKAEKFKPFTNTVNVIDSPLGVPHVSSLVASHILKQNGYDPVFQLCARDRNKTGLINALLGAKLLGLENVLSLTGDYPKDAKPVYEYDSVSLARLIKKEMPKQYTGFDMNVGVAYNPMAEPNEPEQIKLEKKLKYADFVQTQMVFDLEQLDNKIVQKNKKKIIVGVLPLLPGFADYFNKNIPGISIPKEISKSIKSADDGIKLANEISLAVKEDGFAGVHLMVFKLEDRIGEILAGVI